MMRELFIITSLFFLSGAVLVFAIYGAFKFFGVC